MALQWPELLQTLDCPFPQRSLLLGGVPFPVPASSDHLVPARNLWNHRALAHTSPFWHPLRGIVLLFSKPFEQLRFSLQNNKSGAQTSRREMQRSSCCPSNYPASSQAPPGDTPGHCKLLNALQGAGEVRHILT